MGKIEIGFSEYLLQIKSFEVSTHINYSPMVVVDDWYISSDHSAAIF